MFYVFIDFEKAFDTVWREDLRCKLLITLWFKISQQLTGCDDDSIHGIAYIPLDNSKYALIDALSEIENEFQNFQKNSKYLFLHGDFNSRISKEPDVINFESESGNDENVEHLFIDTSDA